jgi:hypothetical protein
METMVLLLTIVKPAQQQAATVMGKFEKSQTKLNYLIGN